MGKQIVLTYEGNDYTLEFNRKTVKRMEDSGFVVDTNKPTTMIEGLFRGAFQMHHRRLDNKLIDQIWDAQNHKDDLLAALVQLYTEPISSLMEDGNGEDENPTWKLQ